MTSSAAFDASFMHDKQTDDTLSFKSRKLLFDLANTPFAPSIVHQAVLAESGDPKPEDEAR